MTGDERRFWDTPHPALKPTGTVFQRSLGVAVPKRCWPQLKPGGRGPQAPSLLLSKRLREIPRAGRGSGTSPRPSGLSAEEGTEGREPVRLVQGDRRCCQT